MNFQILLHKWNEIQFSYAYFCLNFGRTFVFMLNVENSDEHHEHAGLFNNVKKNCNKRCSSFQFFIIWNTTNFKKGTLNVENCVSLNGCKTYIYGKMLLNINVPSINFIKMCICYLRNLCLMWHATNVKQFFDFVSFQERNLNFQIVSVE